MKLNPGSEKLMKNVRNFITSFPILFCLILTIAGQAFGQTTVGMGTEKPNPNAVLELVSERMDQGFLVPRFTTGQRTASGFTSKLSNKDNGLLVFDTEKGKFYYWHNGDWQQGMGGAATEGTSTIWYTGNIAPNNAEGKNGDFYIHSPSGDVYRKQNGNFSVIGNILPKKNEYTAGKGISIGAGNAIVNTGDLDDTNELIKEVKLSGETLLISDAGGDHQVNLGSLSTSTPDADNDPANEIQDLTLSSHQLSITNNASATPINLTPYLDNTDAQTLSFSGTDLSISGGNTVNLSSLQGGAGSDNQNLGSSKTGNNVTVTIEDGTATTFSVADADNATNNETITNMALGGDNKLTITEGGTDHIVDLSSLGGGSIIGDPSSSNELITTASLVGQELVISEGVNTHNIDLSSLGGGSDNQNLGSSKTGNNVTVTIEDGTATTFNVADADNDPANEIQDLSLSSHQLSITNNASANPINLSPYLDNTDAQTLSFSGTDLSISGGNTVNLSSLQGGAGSDNQNLGSSKTGNNVTVTIEDGTATTFSVADADNDPANEKINSVGLIGNTLRITEAGTDYDVNLNNFQSTALDEGKVLVGNSSGIASPVSIGGDAVLGNDGKLAVTGLQGHPVAATSPANGNLLLWNGTAWVPGSITMARAPDQIFWFSSNINPQDDNYGGGQIGDLFFKYDDNSYWRKIGNPGQWTEILGPGIGVNGKLMNGQLNTGAAPAVGDRQPGMLWLDSGGDGGIKRWSGSQWELLLTGD